jgi:hypothetical protein
MKIKFTFLVLAGMLSLIASSQPSVSPHVNTEICPNQEVELTFDNGIYDWTGYSATAISGAVVTQLFNNGKMRVKFTDSRDGHQIKLYGTPTGATLFNFTRIKSVKGLKPTWNPVPSGIVPILPDYNDSFSPTTCATTTFTYTGPKLRYRDTGGTEYGPVLGMDNYEWIVPKNWKVNGTTSDGVNPIAGVSPSAQISMDPITSGEIKMRAANNCNPFTGEKSDWYRVLMLGRPKLTLSASPDLNLRCGDQSVRTFNLTNTNAFSCINGYQWTIGSGWLLPDNSVAGPFINTTVPTLQLKPSGLQKPGDVVVQVKINGTVNPVAYTAATNWNNVPNTALNGPGVLCTQNASYLIEGVPSGTNVAWSVSNSFVASITPTGNPGTLTLLTAEVTITAALSHPAAPGCTFSSLSRLVKSAMSIDQTALEVQKSGPPCASGPFLSLSYGAGFNSSFSCNLRSIEGFTEIQWQVISPFPYNIENNAGLGMYTCVPVAPSGVQNSGVRINFSRQLNPYVATVIIKGKNQCGIWSGWSTGFAQVVQACSGARAVISPNPATDQLTISLQDDGIKTTPSMEEIVVLDNYGIIVKRHQLPKASVFSLKIPDLKTGIYHIRIRSGDEWIKQTFIKK